MDQINVIKKGTFEVQFSGNLNDRINPVVPEAIRIEQENIVKQQEISAPSDIVEKINKSLQNKNYLCELCGYSCQFKIAFMIHKERSHSSNKKFCCDNCDFFTHNTELLSRHNKKCHPKFLCYICGLAVQNLSLHIRKNHEKKSHRCNICGLYTSSIENVSDHIKTIHFKDEQCPYCDLNGSTFLLKDHIKNFHKITGKFKCEYCNYRTFLIEPFKLHLKTIHLYDKIFKCLICCKFEAPSQDILKIHEKGCCGDKKLEERKSENLVVFNEPEFSMKFIFETPNFRINEESLTNVQAESNFLEKTETNIKNEQDIISDFEMKGDFSKKKIEIKKTDEMVLPKLLNCRTCGYTTYSQPKMNKHFNKVHSKNRKFYSCPYCDCKIAQIDRLKRHLHNVHGLIKEKIEEYIDNLTKKKSVKIVNRKTYPLWTQKDGIVKLFI